jgi:hypothetical protein
LRSLELDLVEARCLDTQHGHQLAILRRHQTQRIAAVDDDATAGRRHRRCDANAHHRALERRDVARAVDVERLELRVRWISILEIHPLYVRQIRYVDCVRRRPNAVRFDRVLHLSTDIEQAIRVSSDAVGRHRQARPVGGIGAAHQELDVVRLKSAQPRLEQLVAALGDRDVPRLDENAEQARRLGVVPRHRDETHAVAQHRRAEHRDQERGGGDGGQETAVRPQLAGVDRLAVGDDVDALERRARQTVNERRRTKTGRRTRGTTRMHLDGRQNGRLERFLMLLEIERDLFVAEPWQEGQDDEPDRERHDRHDRHDATRENGRVGVLEEVHRVRRGHEYQPSGGDGDRRAPQCPLGAISIPYATNDTEKL